MVNCSVCCILHYDHLGCEELLATCGTHVWGKGPDLLILTHSSCGLMHIEA